MGRLRCEVVLLVFLRTESGFSLPLWFVFHYEIFGGLWIKIIFEGGFFLKLGWDFFGLQFSF